MIKLLVLGLILSTGSLGTADVNIRCKDTSSAASDVSLKFNNNWYLSDYNSGPKHTQVHPVVQNEDTVIFLFDFGLPYEVMSYKFDNLQNCDKLGTNPTAIKMTRALMSKVNGKTREENVQPCSCKED